MTSGAKPAKPAPGANAVIFGRKGSGKTTLARALLQHHSRCLIVDPLREYGHDAVQVSTLPELADYLERTRGRWRVAYFNDHIAHDFDALCASAYTLGDCLFVVEEADWFCDPAQMPEGFERVIKYGRHQRCHVLAMSRRPSEVHRMLTSQAYEIYCFAMHEPRDLEYLSKLVGHDYAEELPQLAPLHYRYQNLWDRTQPFEDKELSLPARRNSPAAGV